MITKYVDMFRIGEVLSRIDSEYNELTPENKAIKCMYVYDAYNKLGVSNKYSIEEYTHKVVADGECVDKYLELYDMGIDVCICPECGSVTPQDANSDVYVCGTCKTADNKDSFKPIITML
jgi:ribosomal protein L37AE/L43A